MRCVLPEGVLHEERFFPCRQTAEAKAWLFPFRWPRRHFPLRWPVPKLFASGRERQEYPLSWLCLLLCKQLLQKLRWNRNSERALQRFRPDGFFQTGSIPTDISAAPGCLASAVKGNRSLRGTHHTQKLALGLHLTAAEALPHRYFLDRCRWLRLLPLLSPYLASLTGLISILYPVSFAARRAFCPSLPIARES